MNNLPPEIIDGLFALFGAVIGWLIRMLQGRAAIKSAIAERDIFKSYVTNQQNARRARSTGDHVSKTHMNQVIRHGKE